MKRSRFHLVREACNRPAVFSIGFCIARLRRDRAPVSGTKTSLGAWSRLTVLAILLGGATSVRAAAVQSGPMDGSQIDQVGEQVMNSNEFRSVRRTVLEQLPESDVDKGFLGSALRWLGDRIGDVFNAIGNFFRWLFSGFSGPRPARAPAQPSNSPSGNWDWNFGLGGLADMFVIAVIVVIVMVLIVIAAMIVKSIEAKKRNRDGLLSD